MPSSDHVLVVDDNAVNLKLLRVCLEMSGFAVRTAVDAEAALAAIADAIPALILMDLQLPGMDGLELTRRLKADPATRDVVVIAVTAYAMKSDAEKARLAGCDDYVSKPIDTRALPDLIRTRLSPKAG